MAKELERWGNRTQFSVFECDLNKQQQSEMLTKLQAITQNEDALRIYRLCSECVEQSIVIGGKELASDRDFYQI